MPLLALSLAIELAAVWLLFQEEDEGRDGKRQAKKSVQIEKKREEVRRESQKKSGAAEAALLEARDEVKKQELKRKQLEEELQRVREEAATAREVARRTGDAAYSVEAEGKLKKKKKNKKEKKNAGSGARRLEPRKWRQGLSPASIRADLVTRGPLGSSQLRYSRVMFTNTDKNLFRLQ